MPPPLPLYQIMLKLSYTETSLHLEQLPESLETVVRRRTVLALRLNHSCYIEPRRACLLLSVHSPELALLEAALWQTNLEVMLRQSIEAIWRQNDAEIPQAEVLPRYRPGRKTSHITLEEVDDQWVELGLTGVWLASAPHAAEGIFLTALDDELEELLCRLWQTLSPGISFLAG